MSKSIDFLHVTAVQKYGPFLQIYGHRDDTMIKQMEQNIRNYLPLFKSPALTPDQLQPNQVYLATDGKQYYRSILIMQKTMSSALLEFIDYGIQFEAPLQSIMLLSADSNEMKFLMGFPAIAHKYILANFMCTWAYDEIEFIRGQIVRQRMIVLKEHLINKFHLITLLMPDTVNLETILQANDIGKSVTLGDQANCLMTSEATIASTHVQPMKTTARTINTRNLNAARPLQQQPHSLAFQPPSSIQDKSKKIIVDHIAMNNRHNIQHRLIQNTLSEPRAMPTEVRNVSTLPVFKANELPLGTFQVVYCSYIQDGPKLFSIQLKNQESVLDQMMNNLGNVHLRNLTQKPTIGMACIARYSEDRGFYRAVIVSIQMASCRVTYVDYGNSEDVAYNDIYEIPEKFLEHKTFAIQFSLFGWEQLEPMDDRIKEYFSNLVREAALEIKVMPMDKLTFVQYCELYYKECSVLQLLKDKIMEFNSYPAAPALANGDVVTIRYVKNVKNFHVQRVADVAIFDCMMDKLSMYGPRAIPLDKKPKVGLCCTATWPNDISEWYRTIVLRIIDPNADRVEIEYVDYGIRAQVGFDKLRRIESEFLKLPRQVNECCLVDFEQVDSVPDSTRKQLEMLADDRNGERKHFRVEVHGRTPEGVTLLNLIDDSVVPAANVSAAIYKNSMPRRINTNGNHNNNINPPARAVHVPVGPADSVASNSAGCAVSAAINDKNTSGIGSWSEITATDESHSAITNSAITVNGAGNPNGMWNCGRNGGVGFENGPRDSVDGEKRKQPYAFGKSRNNENWAEADKMDNRANNRNRWDRENPDGGQRAGRDAIAENWRNSSGDNANRCSKPDRRSNEFNRRDKFVAQKYVIPRFNRSHRPMNGNTYNLGNGYTKYTNSVEISAYESSEFFAKSESTRTSETSFEPIETEEFVPFTTILPDPLVPLNARSQIVIVLWVSPHEFYVHLRAHAVPFDEMMKQMQLFYKGRASTQTRPNIDNIVIVNDRKEGTFKRCRILDFNSQLNKYRVKSLDYGNKIICEFSDIFDVEKSFTRLPSLAIWCSLQHIVCNYTAAEILERIEKYIEPTRKIQCEFLVTIDEITYVELEVDKTSLKESLAADSIISLLPADCEMKQLTGQVIAIIPIFIKDLSFFRAQIIGCEPILICCYEDLRYAKQNQALSVEFKRQYENQIMLAKVELVGTTNVLHLRLYIPLLTQETPAIPGIPGYPIYQCSYNSQVSHVAGVNVIYIQNYQYMSKLTDYLQQLFEFYSTGGIPLAQLTRNSLCAALSSDGNYYRGQIREIVADTIIRIHYIDYGNDELIPLANLKELDVRHRHQSAFAIKAYLPIECEENVDQAKVCTEIVTMTDQFQLCTNVIENYRNQWIVDITNGGVSLSGRLSKLGFIRRMPIATLRQQIDEDIERETFSKGNTAEVPAPQLAPSAGAKPAINIPTVQSSAREVTVPEVIAPEVTAPDAHLTPVYISHADRPDRFYLQIEAINKELEQFRENLQISAPQLADLSDLRAGEMCIAKYSADDHWYRAKIIDTDGEITSIQFIDYGNTDTITDKSLLKTYDANLNNVAPYALPCALALEPHDTAEWSDAACELMQHLLPLQLHFEYISEGPIRNYVNLFQGERNIAEELIAAKLANPIEIIKSGEKCYVSHANEIGEFYIQMEASSNGLDLMEQYLAEAGCFEPLKEIKAGIMCTALFEDGNYYRARALADRASATDSIQVLFVDYGNTFTTSDVRSLPQNIAELPHMAKKCALRMPSTIQSWSDEAQAKFQEIFDSGATVFTVRLVEPTNRTTIIELLIGDKNICDELAALCPANAAIEHLLEDNEATVVNQTEPTVVPAAAPIEECVQAYVTHAESPQDFYIQLDSKTAELNEMVQLMLGDFIPIDRTSVNCDDIYAAAFEDGAYYRCRVVEKRDNCCRVHFIDYGNTADSDDIRVIPDHLKAMPPLSIHCQLEADAKLWNSEQIRNFLDFVTIDTTFQIEMIDATSSPQIVRLFQADANILITISHSPNVTLETPIQPIINQITPDAPKKNLTFESSVTTEILNGEIAVDTFGQMMDNMVQQAENMQITANGGGVLNLNQTA